jgi:hypothetical protein
VNRHVHPFRLEAGGQGPPALRRQFDIKYALALITIKMAVFRHVRAEPRRAALEGDLPRQPALHQGVQAVVHRCHRNVGHRPLRPNKHFLRRRVVAFLQKHSIDVLPLRRKTKTARRQAFVQPRSHRFFGCRAHDMTRGNLIHLGLLSIVGIILKIT